MSRKVCDYEPGSGAHPRLVDLAPTVEEQIAEAYRRGRADASRAWARVLRDVAAHLSPERRGIVRAIADALEGAP